MRTLVLLSLVFGAAACTPDTNPGGPDNCPQDGQFDITWTIRGQPVSTACAADGIDHLDVYFTPENGCEGGVITPVLCTEGQMIYRELPQGESQIQIVALDATGNEIAMGSADYDVEPNATDKVAIDLQ